MPRDTERASGVTKAADGNKFRQDGRETEGTRNTLSPPGRRQRPATTYTLLSWFFQAILIDSCSISEEEVRPFLLPATFGVPRNLHGSFIDSQSWSRARKSALLNSTHFQDLSARVGYCPQWLECPTEFFYVVEQELGCSDPPGRVSWSEAKGQHMRSLFSHMAG